MIKLKHKKKIHPIRKIKDRIIKLCGGYTEKEHTRWEEQYNALLHSKTNKGNILIINNYIRKTLRDLNYYMVRMYGEEESVWIDKIWNVIHNNWLRLEVRYWQTGSVVPYKLDTTLDNKDEFLKVLQYGEEDDDIEYMLNNLIDSEEI